jgi:hypothetical protein
MPLIAYLDALDNVASTGRFFVALTKRLGAGPVIAGEDATQLARAFGLTIPPHLEGATIKTMEEPKDAAPATELCAEGGPIHIVVTYPPVIEPDAGPAEMRFKKCFKVCQSVGGGKVCATVCVDITVGLSGVHGNITGTVSVSF